MFKDFFSPIIQQIRNGNEEIIEQIKKGQKLHFFKCRLHINLLEKSDDLSSKKDIIFVDDNEDAYLNTHIFLLKTIRLSYVPSINSLLRIPLTKSDEEKAPFEIKAIEVFLDEKFKEDYSLITTNTKIFIKSQFEETYFMGKKTELSLDKIRNLGWKLDIYKDHYPEKI